MKSLFRKPADPAADARGRLAPIVGDRLEATPGIERLPVDNAQIYICRDYLDPSECDMLIRLIDAGRRPSTLLSETEDANFRTSESCDLDRWAPEVHAIDTRIADLLGIPPENGETIQGQRYAPGQQFRAHHDYFRDSQAYWHDMANTGGQRTWTAMIFLNDVEQGGATWFPQAGVRIRPKRGLLLAWNNMSPDGTPNEATLHEGTAVGTGVKYIITKWFREGRWLP